MSRPSRLSHSIGIPDLPPARTPGSYAIAVVCLGNICRSPLADVVLNRTVAAAGLDDAVRVGSSGTGDWHVGEPMDPRAAAVAAEAGYDPSTHRGRQVRLADLTEHDLVLAMDEQNLADLRALAPAGSDPDVDTDALARNGRLRLFRDFDPLDPGKAVPDPYYGGASGFQEVLAMVERTSDAIVALLPHALEGRG